MDWDADPLWPGIQAGDWPRVDAALSAHLGRLPPDTRSRAGRCAPADLAATAAPAVSWAQRISEALGLASPGAVAAAVFLLGGGGSGAQTPAGREAAIALLREAGASPSALLDCLLAAPCPGAAGQQREVVAASLSAPGSRSGPERLGWEIPLAVLAPGLLGGLAAAPLVALGEALAEAASLYAAEVCLWRDPRGGDLARRPLSPALAPVLGDPQLAPQLLDALAGDPSIPSNLAAIQRILSSDGGVAALYARWEVLITTAAQALAAPGLPPAMAEAVAPILEGLGARMGALRAEMIFRGAALEAVPPRASAGAALRQALADAADALWADETFAEAWEVQRRGVGSFSGPLVGQRFPRALILSQLLPDPRAVSGASALLRGSPPVLRYYDDFDAIPPDADSLGVMLGLAASTPDPPRARIEGWLAMLAASAPRGQPAPTWLTQGPAGPTSSHPQVRWGGDACAAVRLALVCGLLAWDGPGHRDAVDANLRAALPVDSGGAPRLGDCFHYRRDFALHLLFAAREALQSAGWAGDGAAAVEQVAAREARDLIASQRLDGGWGDVQASALILGGLARGWAEAGILRRGARFVVARQRGDGAWDAEPLWITFGGRGATVRHRSRLLTTALVVGALRRAERALAEPGSGG